MRRLADRCVALILAGVPACRTELRDAEKLVIAVQPSAEVFPGQRFPTQPVIQVADRAGDPVALSGVLVTASTNGTDGQTLGMTTALSNEQGQATFTALALDGTAEMQQLRFSHPDLEAAFATTTMATFATIDAGGNVSCGLTKAGHSYCWGRILAEPVPRAVRIGSLSFDNLSVASLRSCALTSMGAAWCFGQQQLGNGTQAPSTSWVAVSGALAFRQISAGGSHTCAIALSFSAYCWGQNNLSQLGSGGSETEASTPQLVTGGHSFSRVSAGADHTCAITTSGTAYCWGNNSQGQLGRGDGGTANVPVPVAGDLIFSDISAGGTHTCGLAVGGALYCWGSLYQSGPMEVPTPVSSTVLFAAIQSGAQHACGVSSGALYCWGDNLYGQLGIDSPGSTTPIEVSPGTVWTTFGLGNFTTCAVKANRDTYCWGLNNAGQVGDGTTTNRTVPTRITNPF